jgi:anti-sigma B factor antagonist
VPISIHTRDIDGIAVLDLSGDSSITDGTILQQTVRGLIEAGKRFFVLNLQNVRYLDSFGLGQIVATYQNVRGHKGDLKIINPNSAVRDLLRYTRIDTVVQVLPSEAEAVQELRKLATQ